jgi:UDP-3-O-[3-hydroxymyristoyl] glucosamine N-acyltransferase
MNFTLGEMAELTNSAIQGDKECLIEGVASLSDADSGCISFVSNPKYIKSLNATNASAVILSPTLAKDYSGNVLVNSDPYLTFAKVVSLFHSVDKTSATIHPSANIAENAIVAIDVNIAANVVIDDGVIIKEGVSIGAGSFIGANSIIESGVLLHPNVTLYSETEIGSNSIIHSGAVIGADGFGYAPQKDKSWYKILQVGNVVIGSDAEIGANTTIDRAALGSTQIGNGVKIDNQIQIGHNTKIGEHTAIAGGALIAGSSSIGKYCQIGGAAGIAGHLNIVDNVIITAKSMVIKSIEKAGVYSSGIPADENRKWRRNTIRFSQLDEMAKTVKQLEAQLVFLSKRIEEKNG